MRRARWAAGVVVAAALAAACRSTAPTNAYNPPTEAARNPVEADRLSRQAADSIDRGELDEAEKLLRRALAHNLYWGPAHNNLGVVFLEQGKLYEAANEFEWARKLMPSEPDPRVNLGICLERAGRTEDAMASFEAALEVSPEHLPATQGAALLAVRSGRDEQRLTEWLDAIALKGNRAWSAWATRVQGACRPGSAAVKFGEAHSGKQL